MTLNERLQEIRRNGALTVQNEPAELSDKRKEAIEKGLQFYHEAAEEVELLKKERGELLQKLAELQVQLDGMHGVVNMLESRAHDAVIQRDEAVAQRAAFEALYVSLMAQLRAFHIPGPPVVGEFAELGK